MRPWYKRKRFWLGLASVVVAVVSTLTDVIGPTVSNAILGGVGAIVASLSAMGNGEAK
jgi:hypothetical protein